MTIPRQQRAIDRTGLEVLSVEECLRLIEVTPVGRVAFVSDGVPTILPVNHRLDGWRIVFRTTFGSKLTLATMERPFAFEVDGYDSEARTGWSVLVRGTAEAVRSRDAEARLEELGLRSWADAVDRDRWVAIHPAEVTGRRILPPLGGPGVSRSITCSVPVTLMRRISSCSRTRSIADPAIVRHGRPLRRRTRA